MRARRRCDNAPPIMDQAATDATLMARVAAGDRDAFAALIERHREYVHKLAYRFVGRWDVADDLTQDTFLRVYRAAATYEPTAAFSTWLYRLVLNLCRDWRKGQSYRQHAPLSDGLPGADGAADAVERQELAEAVRRAVEALPDHQREALILHRFAGLSHREIAAVMEKSESAVESYITRGYASLRSILAAQGRWRGRSQDG